MWKKIKTFFSFIVAVLSVLLFTTLLFLLRRSHSDGPGSRADSERDTRIKAGLGNCEDRLNSSKDRVEQCEERLRRAEDILRKAINRSKEQ